MSDIWSSYTVADLKAECQNRGLAVSGTKKKLIERLVEDDGGDEQLEVEAPAAGPDYHSMNVAQLKAELTNRDLFVSGNKTALIERLEANDTNPEAGKKKRTRAQAFEEDEEEDVFVSPNDPGDFSGERRSKPWVSAPDEEYKKKLAKVRKERLFMLDRQMTVDKKGGPAQKFDIAGSTGNLYKVTIAREPFCECMDAVSTFNWTMGIYIDILQRTRGQKCKHIKYALIIILKAPAHLCYQNAFLTSEIQSIFANAPVTQAPVHDHNHEEDESMYNGKRKPIDGECPICVFSMEADEDLVWCKAACGQNFHKECLEQWKRSKHGGQVTCVYCRQPWQEDVSRTGAPSGLAALKEIAPKVGHYKNVAHLMPQYSQPDPDH
ncbi:hypothetical protein HYFRA_00010904 [Hymenoscyphus fraxineus]|uniref:Postreplication repair E3 ubiquitin-protein ligase RAD18 n=1 Tax=Hymenoscyphus fraxineus TaxID=746836 RepID=A0A9N9KW50_9HELO|nr:hypothetical protein HYFRA_00010904 [Hymenoscyphus fraxineus]